DVNLKRPLGTLTGEGDGGVVRGTFVLPRRAFAGGSFQAQLIPLSEVASQQLIGIYEATARDGAGRVLYAAVLIVESAHRWELRRIRVAPGQPGLIGEAAHRLSGRYAVAADGRLLTTLTRVPVQFRQGAA